MEYLPLAEKYRKEILGNGPGLGNAPGSGGALSRQRETRDRPFTPEEVARMKEFLRQNRPIGYAQIFGDEN